ncbi:hemin ABC transporter substrate-binding protein [Pontibacter sp. SGAir0037]|uniref:heme/hemin ABC transporter substrate-binding protein n=1 Tax=Pontibacter sp. SGAir0037 TaxID=2571030 RepID=UPI0010CCB60C|nr:ABC transporter substrate-binding protein [Pontibacter sp. SGAir0037]QCR21137.1 ABC transporter substrate-binding protein [Pontibacter sp. SGAir0037]
MKNFNTTANRKSRNWWIGLTYTAGLCLATFACTPGTGEQTATASSETLASVPASDLKIVTLGGTVSEIVCALGNCDHIVATDRTSTYPAHLQALPSLGYRTGVKAEGIISTGAQLVLAEKDYVDKSVTEQLASTGMEQHYFEHKLSKEGTQAMIKEIGKLLSREDKAQELVNQVDEDFEQVKRTLATATTKPKVLFIYARGQGTLNICGSNTFAAKMIELAGGEQAVKQIEEYKPLTAEAVIAANPDYLLFFDTGLESLGGAEGVLAIPGVKETTAGKQRHFISMDGLYLSGFGPRVGKAVQELALQLHPAAAPTAKAAK